MRESNAAVAVVEALDAVRVVGGRVAFAVGRGRRLWRRAL